VFHPNTMIWGEEGYYDPLKNAPSPGNNYVGCRADLLVVKGDVAKDPRLLMDPENIKVIIKNGKIVKNELGFKNREQTDDSRPDGKDQTVEAENGQPKKPKRARR